MYLIGTFLLRIWQKKQKVNSSEEKKYTTTDLLPYL